MSDYLPLAALVVFMGASCYLGYSANQAMKGESFLKSYFLGNRGLGAWAMALTATVQSGGTFMGYPSFVYTFGWVVALWIASYMVAPLCAFGVLGKRVGQLARRTGAITVPDLLRERFGSATVGGVASLIIIVFFTINMISQFKGGALILKTVLLGSAALERNVGATSLTSVDAGYLIGLAVFTVVVVGYTAYGGFLAAVWTDLFQSVMMWVGVMVLMPLAIMRAGGLAHATHAAMKVAGPEFAFGPGAFKGVDFLPLGAAVSFYSIWAMSSIGSPATLARHMAFKDTRTIRNATFLLCTYNLMIYIPLLLAFICARSILPELAAAGKSDEAMPRLAIAVAHPIVAGLILMAPFGAVMATVSGFLIVIASALVRDVYQRWIDPNASERTIARVTYFAMGTVALLVALAAVHPPQFMQELIVYTGTSMAAAFLFPALMAAYWPRATAAGTMAAMIGGPLTMFALYLVNLLGTPHIFKAYSLCGLNPFVWGLLVSGVLGFGVSRRTAPPPPAIVQKFFDIDVTVEEAGTPRRAFPT